MKTQAVARSVLISRQAKVVEEEEAYPGDRFQVVEEELDRLCWQRACRAEEEAGEGVPVPA